VDNAKESLCFLSNVDRETQKNIDTQYNEQKHVRKSLIYSFVFGLTLSRPQHEANTPMGKSVTIIFLNIDI
jgi:hypothetical protein